VVQSAQQNSSLQALRALEIENCEVDAWLRFGRAPALVQQDGGEQLSDYRFAATPRGNFTTLRVARGDKPACAPDMPDWGYPRADLLAR
jgi:inner membrane protein